MILHICKRTDSISRGSKCAYNPSTINAGFVPSPLVIPPHVTHYYITCCSLTLWLPRLSKLPLPRSESILAQRHPDLKLMASFMPPHPNPRNETFLVHFRKSNLTTDIHSVSWSNWFSCY